jgi:hypothetical protein
MQLHFSWVSRHRLHFSRNQLVSYAGSPPSRPFATVVVKGSFRVRRRQRIAYSGRPLTRTSSALAPSTPASASRASAPVAHQRLGPARLAPRAISVKNPPTLIIELERFSGFFLAQSSLGVARPRESPTRYDGHRVRVVVGPRFMRWLNHSPIRGGWHCRLSWRWRDCRHGGCGRGTPPLRRRMP